MPKYNVERDESNPKIWRAYRVITVNGEQEERYIGHVEAESSLEALKEAAKPNPSLSAVIHLVNR